LTLTPIEYHGDLCRTGSLIQHAGVFGNPARNGHASARSTDSGGPTDSGLAADSSHAANTGLAATASFTSHTGFTATASFAAVARLAAHAGFTAATRFSSAAGFTADATGAAATGPAGQGNRGRILTAQEGDDEATDRAKGADH
jgi:hypothetical protein